MTTTSRQLAITALSILLVLFIYQARSALAPFILAGVFAFVVNPAVNVFVHHLKLPRTLSIFLIYVVLIGLTVYGLTILGARLLNEAKQVTAGNTINTTAQQAIDSLPNWEIAGQDVGPKSAAQEVLKSLQDSATNYQRQAIPFFSGAAREAISFLVFLLASFYLLRDGHRMKTYLLSVFPDRYDDDFKVIWGKITVILGNYLRGQLILITIMAIASYIVLKTLGVQYALILAVLTGFLEIIPYVGPVVAGALAAGVAFLTGTNRFVFDPGTLTLVVIAAYFVLRQLEDYFVIPHLYARLTKIHPLVVVFAVLAGGQLFDLTGLVLAVPVAASAKVVLEYLIRKS